MPLFYSLLFDPPLCSMTALISNLVTHMYSLPSILSTLYSLYQHHQETATQLMNEFSRIFNESTFYQGYSTQQQSYIFSVIYASLKLAITFTSHSDEYVMKLMRGVSHHLGCKDAKCKGIVIGIAQQLANIVAPESEIHFEGAEVSDLDDMCATILGPTEVEETPSEEVSEGMTLRLESSERLEKLEKPEKPKNQWMEMDEIVDIFEEETRRLLGSTVEEEEAPSEPASPEESWSEPDFLPYDLTEPANQEVEGKEYFYLVEPIQDLSNQDIYVRMNAWKGFVSLCKNEELQSTEKDIDQVLKVILEMEEMSGDDDFWSEFKIAVSTLIYRSVRTGIQTVFQYAQQNSRDNMTITKCGFLLQSIVDVAHMLVEGRMHLMETDSIQQVPSEIVISPSMEDPDKNGMIRIANTKYKSSYYKNKMKEAGQQDSSKHKMKQKETKNQFTENAPIFLDCLLTWIIRFPPRNNTSISYLLIALSSICKLPILHGTFNERFPDIVKVIQRYRFHSDVSLRRNCLELFIATTKYEHRECIDKNCEEFQSKERIQEWMLSIYRNDPDDICRLLAKSILSQL